MFPRITRPAALAVVAAVVLALPVAASPAGAIPDPLPADGSTAYGASFGPRSDRSLYEGRAEAARIFYQARIPAVLPRTAAFKQAYAAGVRTFVMSWKDPDPLRVAVALASLPDDVRVYGTYFHEPENDIAQGRLTLAQWRVRTAVQAVVMRTFDVVPTSILMAFTVLGGKGREVSDYYASGVDVFGFDYYPDKVGPRPAEVIGRMADAADASGAGRLLLGEYGVLTGADDGPELVAETQQALEAAGAEVATYWSQDLHRLTPPVADAWFD